jgi:hypothetical protein
MTTILEEDLLSALVELYETSKNMTSGNLPTGTELERYHQALAWSERVIKLAESGKRSA